ncbi:HNH endonuclease [Sulfitobacter sp. M13]
MATRRNWTEDEVTEALSLYLLLPFGKFHSATPQIIRMAERIGRTPSSVAMKLSNLAALDETLPQKGLANLSALDRQMWARYRQDPSFVFAAYEAQLEPPKSQMPGFSEQRQADWIAKQSEVTRRAVVQRRGQSFFREMIMNNYRSRCALTGIDDARLLTASHIVGWQENEAQRFYPENGICLNALHDRAFDRHLISFDDDYRMLIADDMPDEAKRKLTVGASESLQLPERFLPDPAYLQHHRQRMAERQNRPPLG